MGADWRVVGIFIALGLFGVAYNRLIAWMEREGHTTGYLAFLVAFGVAVTGVGWGLITRRWGDVLLLCGCFVASGTPMIIGSMARYMRARARDRAAEREVMRRALGGRTC